MNLRLEFLTDLAALDAAAWNALLAQQAWPTPFMRAEYFSALHASGSAVPASGWSPCFALLYDGPALAAACPLYLKSHSWGEYVFDFAWAQAYAEHGLAYYPKALVAVPFTPVPGSRLLARDARARAALVQALRGWCQQQGLSSLHVLFGDAADQAACQAAGLMPRQQVQFHWQNRHPSQARAFSDFDDFLACLTPDKRKKIRQERRKVASAGVVFRCLQGRQITPEDWAFFYRCHERTYLEHGHAPYLSPAFFSAMARDLPDSWVMFVAELNAQPVAASLIAVDTAASAPQAAYGRYWGALQRVDCLHFEACYYQPIDWCIRHGITRFEGGAQGEHKMARALLPVPTASAHWLAHPDFAQAVEHFLARETVHVDAYLQHLHARSPLKAG